MAGCGFFLAVLLASLSRRVISLLVKAAVAGASGTVRFSMVSQYIRQLTMHKTEISLASLSAVLSFESSALQPDFRTLKNTSIFHRVAYGNAPEN